jgi:ssRNA-specific RNase YbeY (16S rRNA maturation enzyme)
MYTHVTGYAHQEEEEEEEEEEEMLSRDPGW